MSDFSKNYTEFLHTRSLKAKIYRNFILYPKLCKYLSGKTLDLGCGLGDFVKFRTNTIGLDVNPNNVDYCNSLGLNVRLMGEDVIPFGPNEIDSINFDNVLEHIENPDPLIHEIKRVLKPNGTLLVGVPGILGYSNAPDHVTFYSPDDLKIKFINFGFTFIKLFYTPIRCKWLDKRLKLYCYYGIFRK